MSEPETDDLENLLGDIDRQIRRTQSAKALEFKYELSNNVYPLIKMILGALVERIGALEEVVADIADGDEGQAFIPQPILELVAALMQLSTSINDRFVALAGDKLTDDEKVATAMLKELVEKLDTALTDYAEGGEEEDDEDDEDEEK